jgi:hypothetical protein
MEAVDKLSEKDLQKVGKILKVDEAMSILEEPVE